MTAPGGSEDAGLVLSAEERELFAVVDALLDEHDLDLKALEITRADDGKAAGYTLACRCGFRWTPVRDSEVDYHRGHVAAVLAAHITRTPPPAGDAQGAQDARNGPVSDGDAGDGRGHGRDDESGRGASRG